MNEETLKLFHKLKEKHPDALLLFHCGGFYKAYCEDAVVVSRILGLTLAKDTKNNSGEVCGFSDGALNTYLSKLVRAGYRVAICGQLDKPKKLAKRGVIENEH